MPICNRCHAPVILWDAAGRVAYLNMAVCVACWLQVKRSGTCQGCGAGHPGSRYCEACRAHIREMVDDYDPR